MAQSSVAMVLTQTLLFVLVRCVSLGSPEPENLDGQLHARLMTLTGDDGEIRVGISRASWTWHLCRDLVEGGMKGRYMGGARETECVTQKKSLVHKSYLKRARASSLLWEFSNAARQTHAGRIAGQKVQRVARWKQKSVSSMLIGRR